MKSKTEKPKKAKKASPKKRAIVTSIANKTIIDFLRVNLIWLGVILAVYLIGYLYYSPSAERTKELFNHIASILNKEVADYIIHNGYVLILGAFFMVFVFN